MPHAQKLKGRSRWIGQRTEQVERGMHAQLPAHVRDTSGRTMEKRRKRKTNSVLVEASFSNCWRGGSVDAQRVENVGASRIGRCSARTVFRHRQSGACNDECCCR